MDQLKGPKLEFSNFDPSEPFAIAKDSGIIFIGKIENLKALGYEAVELKFVGELDDANSKNWKNLWDEAICDMEAAHSGDLTGLRLKTHFVGKRHVVRTRR